MYITSLRYDEMQSLDGGFLQKQKSKKEKSFANTEALACLQNRYDDTIN